MMRSLAILALLAVLASWLLGTPPARALPPSPDAGAELVARWCADCHMGQRQDVPSFQAIASRRSGDHLRRALSAPHAQPMGGIPLNEREIDDVVAYLNGLKR